MLHQPYILYPPTMPIMQLLPSCPPYFLGTSHLSGERCCGQTRAFIPTKVNLTTSTNMYLRVISNRVRLNSKSRGWAYRLELPRVSMGLDVPCFVTLEDELITDGIELVEISGFYLTLLHVAVAAQGESIQHTLLLICDS